MKTCGSRLLCVAACLFVAVVGSGVSGFAAAHALAARGLSVTILDVGEELDPQRRRVTMHGRSVELTATEFDLLAHLVRHPGRVYTREHLLSAVWGYEAAAGTRTVDVHVSQLRSKLGDDNPIRTVRGVGYSIDG